jgi:uncharacterized protein (DUF58 family)
VATPRPLRSVPLLGPALRAYEERLTGRGRALLWAVAALALIGMDTRRSQVYRLFAVVAAAGALAVPFARLRRPRVRLACPLPGRATALAPLMLKARMEADAPAADLRLHFPRPLHGGDGIRFDPEELALALGPGAPVEAAVTLTPLRRGRYELRGPRLRPTDPLGLATGRAVALPDQVLLVYPRYYTLDRLEVPQGRRYQPGGIPLSSSTGDAIEFIGTREYREGDPVRNIHWRSWARRGEPVVKEHQEEYFCRIAIILDTFTRDRPSRAELAAFEAAISVVASIADHFSRSEFVVDILAAGPDIYEVSAGRSLAYLENILDVLACLEPCHEPPFAGIGPALFERLARTTTVVAVLQDWDAPREGFLRRVKEQGAAVRGIVVHDGPTGRPWVAAAGELGELSQLTPGDVESGLRAGSGRV